MKFKKTLIGMALAAGAVVAPFTGKANTETNAAPKTVELSKAEKAQKLKEAIKSGASRDELLKYVDFPEWMPVTKDGKYDSEKAKDMYKASGMDESKNKQAFIDYVGAVEKGGNPDIEFQKFAKQVTNGDPEKIDALNKVKDAFQKAQERTEGKDLESHFNFLFVGLTLALAFGANCVGSKMIEDAPFLGIITKICAYAIAGAGGMGAKTSPDLCKLYQDTVRQAYTIYANQEIQKAASPEASKVVQMDMQQAKQFIEMAKKNGPEK